PTTRHLLPSHDLCAAHQPIGTGRRRTSGSSIAPQETLEAPRTSPGRPGALAAAVLATGALPGGLLGSSIRNSGFPSAVASGACERPQGLSGDSRAVRGTKFTVTLQHFYSAFMTRDRAPFYTPCHRT